MTLSGYATIATWTDPRWDEEVWELVYPITRAAWFRTSMGAPEGDPPDDAVFAERNISADLQLVKIPYSRTTPGQIKILYNRTSKEARSWQWISAVLSPFGERVLASAWIHVLRLEPDSGELRDALRMRTRFQDVEAARRVTERIRELATDVTPVMAFDDAPYRLLGLPPPWLFCFDDFVVWHRDKS